MALIAFVSTVRTLDFFLEPYCGTSFGNRAGDEFDLILQNLRTNYLGSRTVPDKKTFSLVGTSSKRFAGD